MAKDKIIHTNKKKKPNKRIQKKLQKATDKLIDQYGDVLKKLGKT
ncbi:MAG: hypothetical protein WCW17_00555 [Patescibacteria group bacterium]|jgi:hypothetical protein